MPDQEKGQQQRYFTERTINELEEACARYRELPHTEEKAREVLVLTKRAIDDFLDRATEILNFVQTFVAKGGQEQFRPLYEGFARFRPIATYIHEWLMAYTSAKEKLRLGQDLGSLLDPVAQATQRAHHMYDELLQCESHTRTVLAAIPEDWKDNEYLVRLPVYPRVASGRQNQ